MISRLFFADDLLLFAEAKMTQIPVIEEYLDTFCMTSGQQVNYAKSHIYCSPNTLIVVATDIANISGSPLVVDL